MKILITGVGGPTPRSFALALKKYSSYKNFQLFGTDSNPLSMGLYLKDLFHKTFVIPPANSSNYWPAIKKIIKENHIDAAVILPELEVLEWSRIKSKDNLPCPALIPDYQLTKLLINKSKLTEVLKNQGIVPPSITFNRDSENLEEVINIFNGSFWVRSTTGSSGLGSLKIDNENSLKTWIQINPDVKEFLASKYLPGRNLACKLLYYNGKLLRTACCERVNYIMSKVSPSGITGNTSFGRFINDKNLVNEAKRTMDYLFKHVNSTPHVFFTIDFKEDSNGKAYITEINVRHVAFTQCFAAGGANFAADTMHLLNNDPEFDKEYKMYEFEKDLIFLRDVDTQPILIKESDLLSHFETIFYPC